MKKLVRCLVLALPLCLMLVSVAVAGELNGATATTARPLSDAQLQKIIKNLKERNKRETLDPAIGLLGLTKNGELLTVLARSLIDKQGITHGFYLLNGDTGYIVGQQTEKGTTACRIDMNLNLVSAVFKPSDQSEPYVVPLSEAAEILHTELLVWAEIADHVIGANPQVPAAARP
jgi:hypothetical protein